MENGKSTPRVVELHMPSSSSGLLILILIAQVVAVVVMVYHRYFYARDEAGAGERQRRRPVSDLPWVTSRPHQPYWQQYGDVYAQRMPAAVHRRQSTGVAEIYEMEEPRRTFVASAPLIPTAESIRPAKF
jgi:hypothetical protein